MKSYHLLTLFAIFAIGYVVARYFPGIGNKVGLP